MKPRQWIEPTPPDTQAKRITKPPISPPRGTPLVSVNRLARWLSTDRADLRLAREARVKVHRLDGRARIEGRWIGLLWCMLCLRRGKPKRRRGRKTKTAPSVHFGQRNHSDATSYVKSCSLNRMRTPE